MTLQTYIPPAPLSSYIQMLWYWAGYHPPHPKERILPNGMMEITVNLADEPFLIYDPQHAFQPQSIYGMMAGGARSDYFVVDTMRPASVLAVWFKPGGALPFLGVAADEVHNAHLPLELLWGLYARDVYCRLLEARSTIDRFHILEHALLHRLSQAAARHRAIDYALAMFGRQPQTHKIAEVVNQLALSPARFIQLFRQDVGMTPKQFCRVQRFQQALRLIARQPAPNWVDIALTCGYYDQAHFINDFQAFAGITPTAYAPQSREHHTNLAYFD
ncbi:MAG: AraC family transcriptional regulator [Armatimonadetes bacterium]|nr:AraC family transcriptional regulator [Anaerolineae bacterium]